MLRPALTLSPQARLALWAYRVLMVLIVPVYLARLWWRGRVEPAYRTHLGARLGLGSVSPAQPATAPGSDSAPLVWIHAVSLGETRAALALADALRSLSPGVRLLWTHSTATGLAAGQAQMQAGDAQTWLPLDNRGAVRRFLKRHRPTVGVLMETEVWPELSRQCAQLGVPLVLANARLSEKSLRQGQRLAVLMQPALRAMPLVLAQTQADAQRILTLRGDSPTPEVRVVGNLKYDVAPDAGLLAQGRQWRALAAGPLLLAASFREGEEAALLDAWQASAWPRQGARLLLVPRHPQRFDEVAALITARGYQVLRRSGWDPIRGPQALWDDPMAVGLGDSLGEMPLYYACANLALLGGSFEPLGGQNLIEAAACGCPLIMGPHTFNFAAASEAALAQGAAWRVPDMPAAVALAGRLLQRDAATPVDASVDELAAAQAAAMHFASAHRGAALTMARAVLGLE